MATLLLKKSYLIKDLKEIKFKDLWNDYGVFTTMRVMGKDKKILLSGDTGISENLKKYGKNLDILVHEVFSSETFVNKTKEWQIYHQSHHTSSIDLGIIADELKPKKLVLSHILYWGATDESLLNDIRQNFDGPTLVAKDLMIID